MTLLHNERRNLQSDPFSDTLLRSGIFNKHILGYSLGIKAILGNPQTAIYGASGAGFSDFHATIGAKISLFVTGKKYLIDTLEALSMPMAVS